MVWRNPYIDPNAPPEFKVRRDVESVRVATCQFQARAVKNFEEFVGNVEYFVEVAADYRADFVVFPELFTLQLLAFEKAKLTPMEAIDRLTDHTPNLTAELSRMALRYNINIIGGSHPTRTDDGDIQNVAIVCLRDGSVHLQEKIHPTPNERYWWKIKGGDRIDAIQTDCGPIGVLICYDSEFPELARGWWTKGRGSSSSPSAPTAAGLSPSPLLQPGPRHREPSAMSSSRQCRQPAQRREYGHPVRTELHIDALRLSLRARRDRGRSERECRDADHFRPEPRRSHLGAGEGTSEPRRRRFDLYRIAWNPQRRAGGGRRPRLLAGSHTRGGG
jgi:hypothetical protein